LSGFRAASAFSASSASSAFTRRHRGLIELAEGLTDLHDVAVVLQALDEDARRRCGNLDVDLVGLQLDERVAFLHGIALVLQPSRDRSFDDGFA